MSMRCSWISKRKLALVRLAVNRSWKLFGRLWLQSRQPRSALKWFDLETWGYKMGDFFDEGAGTISRTKPPSDMEKRRCRRFSGRARRPAFNDEKPRGCIGLPKLGSVRSGQQFEYCFPLDSPVGLQPERPVYGLRLRKTAFEERHRGLETRMVALVEI